MLAWGAAAIMVMVFVGWGLEMAGYQIVVRYREEGASAFRVVPARAAMFLLSVALVLLPRALESRSKCLGLLVGVFVLQVLLLQHRSVWLAALPGITLLAALYWRTIRRLAPYLPLVAIPAVLATAVLLLEGALDGVLGALSHSVQNEGTFLWRLEGWVALMTGWQSASVVEKLIGGPFGTGFSWYLGSVDMEVTSSPHNSYLVLLLRVGVLGLAAFLMAYATCIRKLLANRQSGASRLQLCLVAVLCAQCVFFMFYGPSIMQAVFLGSALAVCPKNAAAPAAAGSEIPSDRAGWQTEGSGRG